MSDMNTMTWAQRVMRLPLPVDQCELALYRDRAAGMLRKYFRLAMETGRLPSMLGGMCFRAKVTSYKLRTFEDTVIFVHDVERCLAVLDKESQQVIARVALQGHTHADAARLLGMLLRSVERKYPEALDKLSALFLRVELLRAGVDARWPRREAEERVRVPKKPAGSVRSIWACQAAESARFATNASRRGRYKFSGSGGISIPGLLF